MEGLNKNSIFHLEMEAYNRKYGDLIDVELINSLKERGEYKRKNNSIN